jgi:heme-degrading monooxygenase HmoA
MEPNVIAMIFEFWMDPTNDDLFDEYSATSAELRSALAEIDGFGGVERFQSCTEPGKFVAVGFFDDEAAVAQWRNHPAHRHAQELGRSRYFTNYRLRMAELVRDYGPHTRADAPTDSNAHHEWT